jgi:pilus assembly protein Flp/PilA
MFRQLAHALVRFINREDGPTAVEYAVMLALIIVVCNANSTFTTVGNIIGGAGS